MTDGQTPESPGEFGDSNADDIVKRTINILENSRRKRPEEIDIQVDILMFEHEIADDEVRKGYLEAAYREVNRRKQEAHEKRQDKIRSFVNSIFRPWRGHAA